MITAVYVGTFGKYAAGSLAGKWFDLEEYADKDEFEAACQQYHGADLEHEFMYQDWQGIPDGLITESGINASLWEWLRLEDETREIVRLYAETGCADMSDFEDVLAKAEDAYCGVWECFQDYSDELVDVIMNIPEHILPYFDYKKFAHDLAYEYTTVDTDDGRVMIFHDL